LIKAVRRSDSERPWPKLRDNVIEYVKATKTGGNQREGGGGGP